MSIASNTPAPLSAIEPVPHTPGLCNAFLLASLIVVASQLIGIDITHADEAIPSKNDTAGQAAAAGQQPTGTSPEASEPRESPSTHFDKEVHCLALNIYFEARSEPESGQRAVGHVVMNRVAHPRYPDSVCRVVQQGGEQVRHRCQFSWWCDGRSDKPINRQAWCASLRLARAIYLGVLEDTTDGALWYHASYVKPYWSEVLRKGPKFGQHVFYLEHRQSRETM